MKILAGQLLLATLIASMCMESAFAEAETDAGLKVLIIRHGEKPKNGENLTCQGENRARQIPAVLEKKFGKMDYLYVPTVVGRGDKTLHSRMFQTATPTAIRNGLEINSQFSAADAGPVAQSVLKKKGTVLLVWNHKAIAKLAQSLGVTTAAWQDADYDRILVIRYPKGQAMLEVDAQGLSPALECVDR